MKDNKFYKYFTSEYWSEFFKTPFHVKNLFQKWMRIAAASYKGFNDDDCAGKASALTFYSLLSIIPVLAVALGIAKGFGFERHLENELTYRFSEQRQLIDKLITFTHSMLQNAQGGVIAGVGLIVLFWTVLKLLGNIETSFNAIWKIQKPRLWGRRLSDYFAMMLFCPLFIVISSSISVFIMTRISQLTESGGMWQAVSPIFLMAVHLFPFVLAWMLFTALYYIMPNAQVPFFYAATAGVITGTIYQIVQWVYIQFQIGLASYGAVYGSFAALPLFLVWLNTSWLIALGGAEIAYHAENDQVLDYKKSDSNQKPVDERVIGLLIMHECIEAFMSGNKPPSGYDLARSTGVSVLVAKQIATQLAAAGLLVEVTWKDGTSGYYHPGIDPSRITLKHVCDALDTAREERYIIVYSELADGYHKSLETFDGLLKENEANVPLNRFPVNLTSEMNKNS